jgi:hypothetical protein
LADPGRLRRLAGLGGLLAAPAPQRDSRFLAASGKQEDDTGKVSNAAHFDESKHSATFGEGFRRLIEDNKLLLRLIGASAAWFLMDASSPLQVMPSLHSPWTESAGRPSKPWALE